MKTKDYLYYQIGDDSDFVIGIRKKADAVDAFNKLMKMGFDISFKPIKAKKNKEALDQ